MVFRAPALIHHRREREDRVVDGRARSSASRSAEIPRTAITTATGGPISATSRRDTSELPGSKEGGKPERQDVHDVARGDGGRGIV